MIERIRERAYQLWEADGRPDGDGQDYWERAENEVVSQAETERWAEQLNAAPKRFMGRRTLRRRS